MQPTVLVQCNLNFREEHKQMWHEMGRDKCHSPMEHYKKSGVPDAQNDVGKGNIETEAYSRCRFAYVRTR